MTRMMNLFASLLCFALTSCSHLQKQSSFLDWLDPLLADKILAMDPASLTEKQFYECEQAIVSGYSGSGGHFLEGPQIAWLRKSEAAFQARGMKLRDRWQRGYVIADSYFNHQRYDHAYEEFKAIHDQAGMELSEWFIYNKGIKSGVVSIREYPGRISWEGSENTRMVEEWRSFVAYFKGPVYRYDRLKRTHAIIYAPEDKYDWCDKLSVEGRYLTIVSRDNAVIVQFDNETNEMLEF